MLEQKQGMMKYQSGRNTTVSYKGYSYTRAQDYKEKHKLDSKPISDSAFGAHLSFCQRFLYSLGPRACTIKMWSFNQDFIITTRHRVAALTLFWSRSQLSVEIYCWIYHSVAALTLFWRRSQLSVEIYCWIYHSVAALTLFWRHSRPSVEIYCWIYHSVAALTLFWRRSQLSVEIYCWIYHSVAALTLFWRHSRPSVEIYC